MSIRMNIRWRCCRMQHLRALTVLVTLISLSLLFSTFSTRTEQRSLGRQMLADGVAIDHADSTLGIRGGINSASNSVIVIKHPIVMDRSRMHGFVFPPPAALLRSRNLFANRTVTGDDVNNTLALLTKKLEEGRKELSEEFKTDRVTWNSTHPQRLLIVTSWRSGSTFLGQILSEHPGVFNHYEPLMHYGLKQIRPDDTEADEAVLHLKHLLQCRYTNKDFVRQVHEKVQDMMSHNAQVWQACLLGPNRNACTSTSFLEGSCAQFPTLIMKIVRLRLNLTQQLLEDSAALPGLKVLYLVRDPRATMSSRLLSVDWCNKSSDCIEPDRLCADLRSDLDAYGQLSSSYPNRVSLIKYETLAKDPQATFRSIFRFSELFYTRRIDGMVERHTSRDENHPWSTVRKSAERVDRWQTNLDRSTILEIQSVCSDVLDRLGYPKL